MLSSVSELITGINERAGIYQQHKKTGGFTICFFYFFQRILFFFNFSLLLGWAVVTLHLSSFPFPKAANRKAAICGETGVKIQP